MVTIDIAKEFSKYPAGRNPSNGNFSGERFRKEFLAPPLKTGEKVTVVLDGTLGYNSSFLEEAFGGLVRNDGFTAKQLVQLLELTARDRSLISEIWSYVNSARPE